MTFPRPIPTSRSDGKRAPLCRNPSDRFWLGLAIRLAKGTDSRSRVPAKVFQPGSSSIRLVDRLGGPAENPGVGPAALASSAVPDSCIASGGREQAEADGEQHRA